ncbi:MAG: AAA family ATPase [Motiliproteus sp.]
MSIAYSCIAPLRRYILVGLAGLFYAVNSVEVAAAEPSTVSVSPSSVSSVPIAVSTQQPPGQPILAPSPLSAVEPLPGHLPQPQPSPEASPQPEPKGDDSSVSTTADVSKEQDAEQAIAQQQLAAIQARFEALAQQNLNNADYNQGYSDIYADLRQHLNSRLDRLEQRIKQPPLNLALLDEVGNDAEFERLLGQVYQLRDLLELRQQVFSDAPDPFLATNTSAKLEGVREAKLEWRYIRLQLLLIGQAGYQRTLEIPLRFIKAPIDLLTNAVMIIIAVVVFKLWRRWARDGISLWRKRLLDLEPRSNGRINLARLLWYFDNTRAPLEWLLLLNFVMGLSILQLHKLTELLLLVLFWITVIAFVYLLLICLIERSKQSLVGGITQRQMLSLKLVVYWVGFYLVGEGLLLLFAGNGTLVSWLTTLSIWLFIPIYLFLVVQWKNNAFEFVQQERDTAAWMKKQTVHSAGVRGFLVANLCIFYALYFSLSGKVLRLLSRVESGRRLTAEIYRKRLSAGGDPHGLFGAGSQPVSEETKRTLIDTNENYNQAVCQPVVEQIEQMLAFNEKSHVAIVAERGMGKSTLLELIQQRHPQTLRVDCTEGFEQIVDAVKQQLGLADNSRNDQIIDAIQTQQISMILLDNCHRLACPAAGGQRQLKRLYGWINELREQVLWIMTFEANTWQLITALNIASGFYSHEIKLKRWSQPDIAAMLLQRCQIAQLDVSYGHLQIPRQIADIEEDSLELRNRSGINRIIWGFSEGNPAIAARVFADSVRLVDGRALATLPDYPSTSTLEEFDIHTLLVLRVICQFGRAGTGDLIDNLRVHALVVNSAIATCLARGIIDSVEGRYRISWLWLRVVTKFLARQNLLSS